LLDLNVYLFVYYKERINFASDHLREFPSIVEKDSYIRKIKWKAFPNTISVDGIEALGLMPQIIYQNLFDNII